MSREIWERAIEILRAADRGEMPFEIGEPWEFCGTPTYRIAGWEFGIFDDCASWDYIEWVKPPGGDRLYGEAGDGMFDIWGYRPVGKLDASYGAQMKAGGM